MEVKLIGMLLTDFTNWYIKNKVDDPYRVEEEIDMMDVDSLWGNLQSFADTVDYDLVVFRWQNKFSASVYENNYKGLFDKEIWQNQKSKQREQARIKVIENFTRIYNEAYYTTS